MSIQRYDHDTSSDCYGMRRTEDGDFVKYEDHRAAMAQLPLPNPSADEEVETPRTNEELVDAKHCDECGYEVVLADAMRKLERELTQLRQQHNAEREELLKRINFQETPMGAELLRENQQLRTSLAEKEMALNEQMVMRSQDVKTRDELIESMADTANQWQDRYAKLQSELATAQAEKHGLEDVVLATRNMSIEAFDRIRALIGASPNDPRPCETLVSELIESLRSQLQTAMEERDAAKGEFQKAEEWNRLTEMELANLRSIYEEEGFQALHDKFDLMLDEFKRIRVLTDNAEIQGLCDRAVSDIKQLVPLIDQRNKAEAERNEANSRLEEARVGLGIAAKIFREYEQLHRAKGTMEGIEKADRNGAHAEQMESLLSRLSTSRSTENKT